MGALFYVLVTHDHDSGSILFKKVTPLWEQIADHKTR